MLPLSPSPNFHSLDSAEGKRAVTNGKSCKEFEATGNCYKDRGFPALVDTHRYVSSETAHQEDALD